MSLTTVYYHQIQPTTVGRTAYSGSRIEHIVIGIVKIALHDYPILHQKRIAAYHLPDSRSLIAGCLDCHIDFQLLSYGKFIQEPFCLVDTRQSGFTGFQGIFPFCIFDNPCHDAGNGRVYLPCLSVGQFEKDLCFQFIAYLGILVHTGISARKFVVKSHIARITICAGKIHVIESIGGDRGFQADDRAGKCHVVKNWFIVVVDSGKSPLHATGLPLYDAFGSAPAPRGSDREFLVCAYIKKISVYPCKGVRCPGGISITSRRYSLQALDEVVP